MEWKATADLPYLLRLLLSTSLRKQGAYSTRLAMAAYTGLKLDGAESRLTPCNRPEAVSCSCRLQGNEQGCTISYCTSGCTNLQNFMGKG